MDRRKFLKTAGATLAGPVLSESLAGPVAAQSEGGGERLARPERPNVIVIICDDLGYGDLACYGSKLRTPNIDRLAARGVRFVSHCTPTPICSASRASLLTGRYPVRSNVPNVFFPLDTDGMSVEARTMGNVLQGAGYKTMAIGKWHLGHTKQYLPPNRGFDEYYGVPYSVDMDPLPILRGLKVEEPEADRDRLTQQYTREAVSFIERSKETPFFLYMAHSYPHIPLHASKTFRGKSQSGIYGDVVEEIDWSVGEVVKAVERNGLERKTLVIFTSDHGPWFQGSTGDLRGRKGMTYEGGVRIPMVASLPGALPAGHVVEAFSSHVDLLPTFLKLCHAKPPKEPLDGVDIWSLMSGGNQEVERKAILHFYRWNIQCARWKQWKLHISRLNVPQFVPALRQGRINYQLRHPELYNMAEDPKESYDVAAEHPDIVALIEKSIAEQLATLPDKVHQASANTAAHLTNPWMPAGSYAEMENSQPNSIGWLSKENAARVMKDFE